MTCVRCGAETLNRAARFCSKCGTPLPARRANIAHWVVAPFLLIGRLLAYPIKAQKERIRWLTEASGPDSPINDA
jgi:hypothetical protein